ncbi:hypothetical protein [Actinoplanes derwentensis]|uniref:Uncharacterized protein n=1 Tax=Actinoplanes derwentensis TaxID=113562 RepID=A0A1H2CRG2_9ACTN|nr:hypothetical protein [Actinoplanes derwentensis]GID83779.1 hypothetical protein Ade03nite_27030 [Actinoplanes derwentensis]SDT72847.1 hypothetical protein SAMN04489716_6507 [Actinoplanes derwentensis]
MTIVEGELRAALRAEAAKHRPDREAMLDRITRTSMRTRHAAPSPSPRLRMTGAAVAVAAVLGGGGFAQWALAGDGEPNPVPTPVVTVEPTPSGPASPSTTGPSGTPSAAPSKSTRTRQSGQPSPSAAASSAPPADPAAQGALWSDGSVVPGGDSQASSVVTVKTTERLTALEVTIRLARTDGLVSRGGSQQVPGASVTSTVTEEPDAIVYRFVLSSGDNLEPGTYTFYARYIHLDGGRDAGGDSYRATTTTATVTGDFS